MWVEVTNGWLYLTISYIIINEQRGDHCTHDDYKKKKITVNPPWVIHFRQTVPIVLLRFSHPKWGFKGPTGRCKATTPSSFSLTPKRVTINY